MKSATLDAVAAKFSGTWVEGAGPVDAHLEIAGKRIAICLATIKGTEEPRLRLDRVALGFVRRLREALSESVPEGKIVVVTITAPIWKSSKTAKILQDEIRKLIATRRKASKATIERNHIQVRILQGGTSMTPKLVGFVHNPVPGPALLFGLTQSVLACMAPDKRKPADSKRDRWLVIAEQGGFAPIVTAQHVCSALRARSVFKRIVLANSERNITLVKA